MRYSFQLKDVLVVYSEMLASRCCIQLPLSSAAAVPLDISHRCGEILLQFKNIILVRPWYSRHRGSERFWSQQGRSRRRRSVVLLKIHCNIVRRTYHFSEHQPSSS